MMDLMGCGSFGISFGWYRGETLDEAASTQKGLKDLDGLVAWMESKGMDNSDFYDVLTKYLTGCGERFNY